MMAVTSLLGCGGPQPPPMVSVSGKVLKSGQPVTAGSLYFHPASSNSYQKDKPSSLLQVDGSFRMKTFPFGEGVPPGKYKVTLDPELATRFNKPQYARPDQTPWEIVVPQQDVAEQVFEVK